jgi:hypothetical protein
MMGEISASGTIFMGCSILMMMENESHYRKKEANEEERKKLLIHKTKILIPLICADLILKLEFVTFLKSPNKSVLHVGNPIPRYTPFPFLVFRGDLGYLLSTYSMTYCRAVNLHYNPCNDKTEIFRLRLKHDGSYQQQSIGHHKHFFPS